MSGHSKWKQIKNKKAATDQKRGQLFSKLLNSIRIAAKADPNPEFNPRLKTAIAKAKAENVPQENIERAVKQGVEKETEELTIEAYGPGGVAIVISAVTDNRNRTISEIKNTLGDFGGKMAEPGSVLWAFEKSGEEGEWLPKFPQELDSSSKVALEKLVEAVQSHGDVVKIFSNIQS